MQCFFPRDTSRFALIHVQYLTVKCTATKRAKSQELSILCLHINIPIGKGGKKKEGKGEKEEEGERDKWCE